ncbi:hypothetical protein [Bradyrhizobium sp. SYSU BS000235]|uniref:hypothetical protein n=1 Tax=Bradyrhizobium sp. SYSU BS000235 TaxID=3411332 RepID=UPI003C76DA15
MRILESEDAKRYTRNRHDQRRAEQKWNRELLVIGKIDVGEPDHEERRDISKKLEGLPAYYAIEMIQSQL